MVDGEEVLVGEVRGGRRIGDMALMGDPTRRETARATVAVETIEVNRPEFIELVRKDEGRPIKRAWQCGQSRDRSWNS